MSGFEAYLFVLGLMIGAMGMALIDRTVLPWLAHRWYLRQLPARHLGRRSTRRRA